MLALRVALVLPPHPLMAGSATWQGRRGSVSTSHSPCAAAPVQQIADGASMRRVGFRLLDKAPAREGAQIATRTGEVIGIITSGGHGHFAGFPVAMGYVPRTYAAVGTELDILVRNKPRAAVVTRMPFVQQNYYRGKEG